jgi:hypothetical protein
VLEGEKVALPGHLSPAGERSSAAAEAIIPRRRISQKDRGGIRIILQADIERRHRERTACGIA